MVKQLHTRLDAAVARYLPDLESLGHYHWSILQAQYATDVVFRSAEDLAPLYDHLLRTAIHTVKVDDVATFLGRSPQRIGERETGGDFSIRRHGLRLEGTRIRHYLGPASIKMYDKDGFILRVETTTNDVTFFRHHRMVNSATVSGLQARSPSQVDLVALPRSGLYLPSSQRPLHPVPLIDRQSHSGHQGVVEDLRAGPRARASVSRLQSLRR